MPSDLVLEDPESSDDINRALPEEVLSILADHEYTWTVLHRSLQEAGRKRHAAWLLSGSSFGNAMWLNWRGGLNGRYMFGRGEFLEALRLASSACRPFSQRTLGPGMSVGLTVYLLISDCVHFCSNSPPMWAPVWDGMVKLLTSFKKPVITQKLRSWELVNPWQGAKVSESLNFC